MTSEKSLASRQHTRQEILRCFREAKHTEASRTIMEAIESGEVKIRFIRNLQVGGRVGDSGTILVNSTMKMDDMLCAIIHEGQHALDMRTELIPPSSQATIVQRAFAELRAHKVAAQFAELNQLTEAGAYRHSLLSPQQLAISIVESYEDLRRISDNALMEIIRSVYGN